MSRRKRPVSTVDSPIVPPLNPIPIDLLPLIAAQLYDLGDISTLLSLLRVSHDAYDAVIPVLYATVQLDTYKMYRSVFYAPFDTVRRHPSVSSIDILFSILGEQDAGKDEDDHLPQPWLRLIQCMGFVRTLYVDESPPPDLEPVLSLIGHILDYTQVDTLMPKVHHFCPPYQFFLCQQGARPEDGGRLNRFLGSARIISPLDVCQLRTWGDYQYGRISPHWTRLERVTVGTSCLNDLLSFFEPNMPFHIIVYPSGTHHATAIGQASSEERLAVFMDRALQKVAESETMSVSWSLYLPWDVHERVERIFRKDIDRVILRLRKVDFDDWEINAAARRLADHLAKANTFTYLSNEEGIGPESPHCHRESTKQPFLVCGTSVLTLAGSGPTGCEEEDGDCDVWWREGNPTMPFSLCSSPCCCPEAFQ